MTSSCSAGKSALMVSAALLAATVASSAWAHLDGRMTGGGSIFCPDRVTHGFELHCGSGGGSNFFPYDGISPAGPNNLEINYAGGNNFHLTNLLYANCWDQPVLDPGQPPAPFDTMWAYGLGTLNGQPASIFFILTDNGEPGKQVDYAAYRISQPPDLTPRTNFDKSVNVVLACDGYLDSGNQQAHKVNGP